ncbi:PREDICTED: uncharacterized protein LOC108763724 [Trachymyrmex cornetzi]|uniref:uncharacterized protein LOC108763724 n=1 Tax=Trachymyrmex cornetzi TaxID=471704 RepID=UPI00084ED8B8|nr:PREDICTED: uncharacterized protein LOC108763724 [Trachymyrmex cornetzi]
MMYVKTGDRYLQIPQNEVMSRKNFPRSRIEDVKFGECRSRKTIDSYLIDGALESTQESALGIDYTNEADRSWRMERNSDPRKPEAWRTSHILVGGVRASESKENDF